MTERREPIGPAILALVACQIGLHACTQGARMAAPLQALKLGQGAWTVGLLLAFFALLPALLAIPAGRLADRYGYHRPVRVAAVLSLCGALIAAASAHTVALCAAAALCGAGSGFGMIAVQRTAGRMARNGTERMRIFSWVALAPAVANLIGPLLAGVLIDGWGFRAAFAALALLPAATLLIAQAVPRDLPVAPTSAHIAQRRPPAWDLLREPAFRRLLIINWLVSTSWDVFGFALPIVGYERGLSASAIGSVLAAYALASMAVRVLIPMVAHRLSRRLMMAGALALTAAVFAAYPLLHSAWAMLLGAALLGLALGAVQPAILASVHDVAPPERQGEALALRSMSVHLSMATMPLLFGAAGAAIGAAALFWLMAAALCAGSWRAAAQPDRAA
jgi:MFS family permease